MKVTRTLIVFGLLTGLGGCADMMGGGSGSTSRSTAMIQPTMAPDMVKQVQAKLRDDGYYKQGNVDGVWGSGTETAVRSFQRDHNLGSSGQLDMPTLQALNLTGGPRAMSNLRDDSGVTQSTRSDPYPRTTEDTVAPRNR